jgi:sugar/nucleoside kinase (ribokinase family)
MLQTKEEEDITGLLGSIGEDIYGELYKNILTKEGVVPIFEKYDKINTGICLVFCHNRDRGHITDLGASILISSDFVNRIWEELSEVKLIYTELFILKHKRDIVFQLAEHALNDKKMFGFNLPSFYFIENFLEDIRILFEHADVVFANVAEAMFYGTISNIPVCK